MKRETQRKCKELNKEMMGVVNKYSNQYKLKKKSNFLWTVKKDFFFDIDFDLRARESDETLVCSCVERCKPLWTDDILWTVLGFDECFAAPMSLRGNGAFAFYGMPYNSAFAEIKNQTIEEIDGAVHSMVNNFDNFVNSFDESWFYENSDKIEYHRTLYELLSLIHNKDYENAYLYADNMYKNGNNYFGAGNKKLPEYAMDYCRTQMSGVSE